MSDRDRILAAIADAEGALGPSGSRAPHPGPYTPPTLPADWGTFAHQLQVVGGESLDPVPTEDLPAQLEHLCRVWSPDGRVVASSSLPLGSWEMADPDADPASLADVSIAILRGALGVAENGAVALDGREARPRALPFLCTRLLLVLDASSIVSDMHAAVARMPPDATAHHHYTWVSGPSKTADIEQTLVLGAHGPKALAVLGVV